MPEIKLYIICANKVIIYFGSRLLWSSIDIVQVLTPIGITNFHVIDISTLFLLYLKDMDIFNMYLNNITNQLICQNSKSISIFYKQRHLWFFVNKNNTIISSIFLIKVELCQVHTCCEYLSVNKLHKLLIQTGHDIKHIAIKMINKFYYYCQIKDKAFR